MSYIQFEFASDAQNAETLSEQLEALGALGITWVDAQDNPIYEPEPNTQPVWDQIIITALFPKQTDINAIQNQLGIIPLRQTTVEDENWVKKNLEDFKPIAITPQFWICPSWHEVTAINAKVLRLNPGLAFGTGEHPTTQMILKYLVEHSPIDNTVLDYGCGSGILALSACILGAKHAYAVDIDPQALIASQSNAQLNNIDHEKISISLPNALNHVQVDLLLANIFMIPLLKLHKEFVSHLKPQGNILLSGILAAQVEQIFITYEEDFHLTIVDQQQEWLLLHGIAKKN
ncbi:MAG: 50S ribosomal protein L11 methyltransferase [Legionellales bacterium]|jgi:ribosomal protein L11 methyltransferase